MSEFLMRLLAVQWSGVPLAYLVVLAVGGLMYVAMSLSSRSSPTSTALAARRPGWIARRRAPKPHQPQAQPRGCRLHLGDQDSVSDAL
jgi:hypothetical protein